MRRLIITIIFISLFNSVRAADTLTTKFINSIYLEVVDPSAKYYYLAEAGSNPKLDTGEIEYNQVNRSVIKEIPFSEFLEAINTDTTRINWHDFNLVKAKCISKDYKPPYSYSVRFFELIPYNTSSSKIADLENRGVIPVTVKPHMSKKEVQQQKELALKKYESMPIEKKELYSFSKPIFSRDKKYVLIGLNKSERGCMYVFKFDGKKWVNIFEFQCWIS